MLKSEQAEAMAEPGAHEAGQSGGSNREVFEERVRTAQVEARARNISHNVRCLECGHQAIEESQAEIAIKLRKVRALDSHFVFSAINSAECKIILLVCELGFTVYD